jgi:GH24 family phage-related lysozyme (muramidase)
MMTPSKDCIDLIKKWEGCYLTAYLCPADVWTIGWGSITNPFTGDAIIEGDVIDQKTADAWLQVEVDEKAAFVSDLGLTLTQPQYDALVSFAYNVGTGALGSSTLLRLLRAGDVQGAANQFDAWIHGNPGEILPGLVSRRAEEKALFLSNASVPASREPVENRVTWLDMFRRSDRGEVGIAAMREGTCLATWQGFDRTSLIDFLGRFPNAGEVLAAPVNKPWPGIGATPTAPVEKFLRLTRVGEKDEFGCEKLLLELVGTGEKWTVVSGQPSVQTFQKGAPTNIPGSGFPLPQGEYDVGEIEFAGETDDYSGTFGAGLGPVWIAIEPKFTTQRSAFGIHLDANRWAGAPGTMGCVGVPLLDDVKRLVKALRANPVTVLRVAWGV